MPGYIYIGGNMATFIPQSSTGNLVIKEQSTPGKYKLRSLITVPVKTKDVITGNYVSYIFAFAAFKPTSSVIYEIGYSEKDKVINA